MGQHSLPGNPPVPLQMRTSARARRITLRISSLDGTVTLTRPRGVSERAALDFARDKEAWLRGHLANQEDAVSVGLGVRLPIEGLARRVEAGQGRRVRLDGDRVLVPGPEERVAARLLLDTMPDLDLALLDNITMPTLVVCGDEDRDNGSAEELAGLLPNAEYVEVPGTHMGSVTKAELGEAIAGWLAKTA